MYTFTRLFTGYVQYIVFLLLLGCSIQAHAQIDTLFWFAAPEVSQDGVSNNFDRPIVVRITAFSLPATVTISQPAGTMPPQVVTVPAGGTQSVDLTQWIDEIETKPADSALDYGLKIQATAPVSAYYHVVSTTCICNPEIFVLKGHNALGTDFWIPSQNFVNNNPGYSPTPYSSFDIVATEDSTSITITPSHDVVGHAAGTTYTITLNAGQTYSATATSQLAANHLQGSRVISDKPVAITVKDDLITGYMYGSCADLCGDQIVPTPVLGTEYIAMKGALYSPYDQLFITATQNNTTLSQDGTTVATINAGDTYQLAINNPSTYIQATAPVYVYQLSGIGCEMGTAILPQLACTGSSSVSFNQSSSEELYINLAVRSGGQGNFLINGVSGVITASQFTVVPGTGGAWYAAHIQLSTTTYPAGSVITVSNSSSLFHLGLLNGGGNSGTSFGYFSNFGSLSSHISLPSSRICEGDDIYLFADNYSFGNYNWTGPNNFTSTLQNPVIHHATLANSGTYSLTINQDGCISSTDTTIYVLPSPVVTVRPDSDSLCIGTPDTLVASGASTYVWQPSVGLDTTKGDTVVANLLASQTYVVTGTDTNGCSGSDTAYIIAITGKTTNLVANICADSSITFNGQVIDTPGTFSHTYLMPSGCDSTVNLTVNIIYPPAPVTITTVGNPCINQPVSVKADDSVSGLTYQWQFAGANIDSGSNAGPYVMSWADTGQKVLSVIASNQCGSAMASDTIDVGGIPTAKIINVSDTDLCGGDTILFSAYQGEGYQYQWQPDVYFINATQPNATAVVKTPGTIKLFVTNSAGCMAEDSTYINVDPCCHVSLPSAFTPNGDGKNDIFRIITLSHDQLVFFRIANRYGQIVFQTYNIDKGWDGTFNGTPQDADTYFYVLKYKCVDGKEKMQKGDLILIR